ncbi:MAG: TolC family outer membrane protein [Ideonella sp.]|nr:TolC family outer membrane protein [Ideonella sp.]MBL0148114.1 TolC family outer membrane protein [Ideonella sp.]
MPTKPSNTSSPRLRVLASVLALCFSAGAAQAQRLSELYDAARNYDAAYLAVRAQADSTPYAVEQARAANRPSLGLAVGGTQSNSNTPYSSTRSSHALTEQVGLNLQYSLYNRANDITISRAARGLDTMQALLQGAEQDLIVRLSQAYFDVLTAREVLNTTQANKKAIAEQLASAKRNFEVGTTTITDTREAQAKYDLAVAQELAAENDLSVKKLNLDQLVGRTGVEPKGLALPVVLPTPQPSDDGAWLAFSANAPSVRKAQIDFDVAGLDIDKAKAADLPTVGLSGSVGVNHTSINGSAATAASAVPFSSSGNGNNSTIGVSLSLPLYSGGFNDNKVKETVALRERARNDLEAARRKAAQDTRTAFFGFNSGLAQVKALEAAESSAKLALEATQLGYKVGVRVNLDVLNAQTQLFQTQRDLAKARYDVILANLRLRLASGQLAPQDVLAVDALLAR